MRNATRDLSSGGNITGNAMKLQTSVVSQVTHYCTLCTCTLCAYTLCTQLFSVWILWICKVFFIKL